KWTMFARRGRYDLPVQNQRTVRHTFSGDVFESDQTLTCRDLAVDNPIKRATGQQLIRAFRSHPGDVKDLARTAVFLAFGRPPLLPPLEISNRARADTEFDQMQGHDSKKPSRPWSRRVAAHATRRSVRWKRLLPQVRQVSRSKDLWMPYRRRGSPCPRRSTCRPRPSSAPRSCPFWR